MKKINILRRSPHPKSTDASKEVRPRVTMRIGARVSVITFYKGTDGRVRGRTSYHSDYSTPQLKEVYTVMQEV